MVLYLNHCQDYYRDSDGRPAEELKNVKDALRPVRKLYGHTLAAQFGPLALKAVRQSMIDSGLCRNTINSRIGRVRRMFKWGVGSEHVPPSVIHGLQAVDGIRLGRGAARESEPVAPVSAEHVDATLPFVSRPVRAMIELQRLCGARPGEVQKMTGRDIDRSHPVWVYRPARHKTKYKGRRRAIPLGPRAQEILRPWLTDDPDAYLFSPSEGAEAKLAERRENRRSPMIPSQAARTRKTSPKRPPRTCYDRFSYRRAIARACVKAGIPVWHPHQLRHSVATAVRARFGLEAAQVVLGHSRADVTQVYAERDLSKAIEVMREVG